MSRSLQPSTLALVVLGSLVAGTAAAQTRGGAECPVATWAYDIDVPSIQVSGDFTINGAEPLYWESQVARLELRSDTLGVVDLGPVYAGSYTRQIVPGTYDVVYLHEQGEAMPANAETVLAHDVVIDTGGSYDFDIPSATVMGDITLNGAPAPVSAYEWGRIELRDQTTGETFEIGRSYQGSYATNVIPGVYDVVYSNAIGGDWVPANHEATLATDMLIAVGITALDVDIPAVTASGAFTLNGAAPPLGMYENGAVSLRDPDTNDLIEVGHTRDQTWTKVVVPGTYDAVYSVLLGGDVVPANAYAVVDTGLVVVGGGVDIDVKSVELTGDFVLDGGNFPGGIYDNSRIWLRGAHATDLIDLGMTIDGSYATQVVPGYYDVFYANLIANGQVPANAWAQLSSDNPVVQLKYNPAVDLDIEVFSGMASVDVTLWGETPPTGVYNNGALLAVDAHGDQTLLGTTRDGGGSVKLISGSYEVHYSHLIGDVVPYNRDAPVGEVTASPFVLPAQIDLHPGVLSGDFLNNGPGFPSALSQLAEISLVDRQNGDVIALGDSPQGEYAENLLGGTYDVVYDYQHGTQIPANEGATLDCVTYAPLPVLQGGRGGLTTR